MFGKNRKTARSLFAGAAMVAVCSLAAPSVAYADDEPTSDSQPAPAESAPSPESALAPTPATSAKPTKPAKPGEDPAKPAADKASNAADKCRIMLDLPVDKKTPGLPLTPAEQKACNKKLKEDKKKAADHAAMIAAAQAQLEMITKDLAKETIVFAAATKARTKIQTKIASMSKEIDAAKVALAQYARQAYMLGADPDFINQVGAFDAGSPTLYQQYQDTLDRVGDAQNSRIAAAKTLLADVEAQQAAAEAAYNSAKATYDLVRLNMIVAKNTLGIASGESISPVSAETFASYPVGECDFPIQNTTNDCKQAQQWALGQVANPMKNWSNLCLGMVTIAYGGPQTYPRAIDMWNSMPAETRHSPNTVAPPGALMFWAPNHVAMSLGNNMLVSTSVLGPARVWIVSFETIQSAWQLPYLGWTAPDFTYAP